MRVELRPDLDQMMARRVRPNVDRLAEQVQRAAQRRAPAVRVWVTSMDERVRPSHVDAHEQAIPANLRFKLRRQVYVPGRGYVLADDVHDLARKPRDPSLPADQRANCRCVDHQVPGIIARSINRSPAVVEGTRVRAQVWTRFPRAAESEFGTSQDEPARFMGGAIDEVVARLRR